MTGGAVLILFNRPRAAESGIDGQWAASDAGVLNEVEAVRTALTSLGLTAKPYGVSTLSDVPRALKAGAANVVINLVEALDGPANDFVLVPAVCRACGVACTGNHAASQLLCVDKGLTNAILQAHGIRTPAGVLAPVGRKADPGGLPPGRFIVKPAMGDASEGIRADAVVDSADRKRIDVLVQRVHEEFGVPALVEEYIDGRELNASVLVQEGIPRVLPLAEIDFVDFAPDQPRIVDYAAKWIDDSFAYRHTRRVIPAPLSDDVAERVRSVALAAWQATGCHDYARVDIRLDAAGCPVVLEVNPNPDISPDAGFVAALSAAGITFQQFVEIILANAVRETGPVRPAEPATREAPGSSGSAVHWSCPSDRAGILAMLKACGVFHEHELTVAEEVLDEALGAGPAGHYQSYTAWLDGHVGGWVCFGPTPCTDGTFDLYWLVVNPAFQRRGLAARMLDLAEAEIRARRGRLIVVETSSRPVYEPARQCYLKHGYRQATVLADFYGRDDGKVVFLKALA